MAEFSEIIPIALFEEKFGVIKEKKIAQNVIELTKNADSKLYTLSLFIWDELVHRKIVSNPYEMSNLIGKENGLKLYKAIRKKVKREIIKEIYSTSFYNDFTPDYSFADISLAQCYPNDIHIMDIELSDTRKPLSIIPNIKKDIRTYHGLNIFGIILENLKKVARDRNLSRISLLVGDKNVYPVFTRYGFKLNETLMSKLAYQNVSEGFSMYIDV